MAVFKRDTEYHTYGDYRKWSRDYGDELINGVAYVREPPSPSRLHQEIVGELHRQVANTLQGKSPRVFVAPFDVRLPRAAEADNEVDTVVQPDLLIVCDSRKIDERGVRGPPEWVAEILAPSTAKHDGTNKLGAYERAGVAEVWLVRPTDRTVSIYRLEAGRYGRPAVLGLKGQTSIASVVDVTIDWDRLWVNVQWIPSVPSRPPRST